MKTVIDAVNELKGDLENTHCYDISQSFFLYYDANDYDADRRWISFLRHCDVLNTSYVYIGDTEEFLATVAECETNFGKCILYTEYKAEYARKEKVVIMLDELHKLIDEPVNELDVDIDWSKAPIVPKSVNHGCSYTFTDNPANELEAEGYSNKRLIEIQTAMSKPATYTQAMADNGVLPVINNEIMYQYGITNYAKGTIKGIDGNQYWIKADCGGYVECNISKLKPLTPPITLEEQAIKDACYIVDDSKRCNDTNINIDCSAAQKAVIVTLIKNGYTKPLTVEAK